jgi:AraC-like DNA-binding protein/quercetin dioxygenase-like cupin family protein
MEFKTHKIKREIVIEGFNSIYYFEFGKDFSHPPEKHDFWEMMYCDSGKINAIANGVGKTVEQGQLIFNRPMEVHAHISNKVDPNNMFVVSFTSASPAMEFFSGKIFTLGKAEKTLISLFTKAAEEALGKIPDDYRDRDPLDFSSSPSGSVQLMECYLTELLLLLLRSGDSSYTTEKRSENSRELAGSSITGLIVDYLKENVYADITLSDVCSKFYMGKSRLCKLFGEYLGEGPIEYFNKLKTAEAKKLLRREELSVGKISDMLSYSSIHNFSRAFKKATGFSPSEYRKKSVHKEV